MESDWWFHLWLQIHFYFFLWTTHVCLNSFWCGIKYINSRSLFTSSLPFSNYCSGRDCFRSSYTSLSRWLLFYLGSLWVILAPSCSNWSRCYCCRSIGCCYIIYGCWSQVIGGFSYPCRNSYVPYCLLCGLYISCC